MTLKLVDVVMIVWLNELQKVGLNISYFSIREATIDHIITKVATPGTLES
jgi:hypothetical protein